MGKGMGRGWERDGKGTYRTRVSLCLHGDADAQQDRDEAGTRLCSSRGYQDPQLSLGDVPDPPGLSPPHHLQEVPRGGGDTSHSPAPSLKGSILPTCPPPGPPLDPPSSPLCSPSWTPRSSLVRSWAPPSTPESASSPEALPSPARVGGCIPEGWGVSGMGGAWCERCCVWSWCWRGEVRGESRAEGRGVRGRMMGGGWKGVGLPGNPQACGGGTASHPLPPPGTGGALPSDPSHIHSTVVSRERWGHKDGGDPSLRPPRARHPHTSTPLRSQPLYCSLVPTSAWLCFPTALGGLWVPPKWGSAALGRCHHHLQVPSREVGGGAEGRRTPMAAFRSLIVTCLARSTAWTTCCWCWGGERGGWRGAPPSPVCRVWGLRWELSPPLVWGHPPPAIGTG